MKAFVTQLVRRNSVVALGFGLPLFFYGSTSLQSAIVIAAGVLFVVPATHAVSYHLELWVGKQFRFVVMLIVAAMNVTIFETLLHLVLPIVSFRLTLFLRIIMVDCLVFSPFFTAPENELFRDRLESAFSLSAGFVVALAFFTALRLLLESTGWNIATSTAVGFLLLGYGKALYNVIIARSGSKEREAS